MPDNTTQLSIAGFLKWFFIVMSLPCFVQAYQGLIAGGTSTGAPGRHGRVGSYVTGDEAARVGWQALGGAGIFLALAWAMWFFWQRNED